MALVGQELLSSGQSTSAGRVDGLIERVTYFNEDSGFCVLRVKASGHRYVVTVVGTLPSVSLGEAGSLLPTMLAQHMQLPVRAFHDPQPKSRVC
jgi:hypothetical protein